MTTTYPTNLTTAERERWAYAEGDVQRARDLGLRLDVEAEIERAEATAEELRDEIALRNAEVDGLHQRLDELRDEVAQLRRDSLA